MNDMNGHRPWRSFRLFCLLVLLISISCAGRCGRDDRPSPNSGESGQVHADSADRRPPELIVELRDSTQVTPSPTNGDLLYGSVPIRQIFAGLTDFNQIEVRQSFPKFSKRWQRDRGWRSGRSDDSLAIAVIEGQILECPSLTDSEQVAVRQFVGKWRQDSNIVRSTPEGVPALIRLLNHQPGTNDSAIAVAFIGRLARDRGTHDQVPLPAIPVILNKLRPCRLDSAETAAVLRFTRRLSKGGAPRAVSTPAMRAALRLTRGQAISLRDSLALRSWIGLLAGSDLPATPGGTAVRPPAVDLFLRVRVKNAEVNTERLLRELSSIPQVKQVTRALPVSKTPPSGAALGFSWPGSPSVALAEEPLGYLQPAPKGVGSETVWGLPGGTGENVRLIVCDAAFWSGHEDLPVTIANETPDVAPANNELQHGTLSLGVLLAQHNAIGVNGMCPTPHEAHFYSYLQSQAQRDSNIDALTAALDSLTTVVSDSGAGGYILLLEAQLALSSTTVSSCARPTYVPVEANPDYFSAIAHLVEYYDVVVIEPAGNGGGELCSLSDGFGVYWNPDDSANNSGAIMVGAGTPGEGTAGTALSKIASSNYGERVDCQGWGLLVQSTSINYDSGHPASAYTNHMETSGASAVVAGVVACVQSTHFGAYDWYLSPEELRQILRSDEINTDQPTSTERIGPLPNLDALLGALCVNPPCEDLP
jgi:hypothetical protein